MFSLFNSIYFSLSKFLSLSLTLPISHTLSLSPSLSLSVFLTLSLSFSLSLSLFLSASLSLSLSVSYTPSLQACMTLAVKWATDAMGPELLKEVAEFFRKAKVSRASPFYFELFKFLSKFNIINYKYKMKYKLRKFE